MKIGHLNVHSYLEKQGDESMKNANIICFTGTFLRPYQDIERTFIHNQDDYQVFRMDRLQIRSEDLARGGVLMIVCPTLLQPVRINIQCRSRLEMYFGNLHARTHSGSRMCIVAVYRRPQQPSASFLTLLSN